MTGERFGVVMTWKWRFVLMSDFGVDVEMNVESADYG